MNTLQSLFQVEENPAIVAGGRKIGYVSNQKLVSKTFNQMDYSPRLNCVLNGDSSCGRNRSGLDSSTDTVPTKPSRDRTYTKRELQTLQIGLKDIMEDKRDTIDLIPNQPNRDRTFTKRELQNLKGGFRNMINHSNNIGPISGTKTANNQPSSDRVLTKEEIQILQNEKTLKSSNHSSNHDIDSIPNDILASKPVTNRTSFSSFASSLTTPEVQGDLEFSIDSIPVQPKRNHTYTKRELQGLQVGLKMIMAGASRTVDSIPTQPRRDQTFTKTQLQELQTGLQKITSNIGGGNPLDSIPTQPRRDQTYTKKQLQELQTGLRSIMDDTNPGIKSSIPTQPNTDWNSYEVFSKSLSRLFDNHSRTSIYST